MYITQPISPYWFEEECEENGFVTPGIRRCISVDLDLCSLNACENTRSATYEAAIKYAMEFRNLCTLETFRDVCSPSGYAEHLEDVIKKDFTRIKGNLRGVKWSVCCCGPMCV